MKVLVVLNGGGFQKRGFLSFATRQSCEECLSILKQQEREEILTVVTGGHLFGAKPVSRAMKEYLVVRGVSHEMIEEERFPSRDTTENLRAVLPILREKSPSEVIVIATSLGHRKRASWILEHLLEGNRLKIKKLSFVASVPEMRESIWERSAQFLIQFFPLGRSPVFKLVRFFAFKAAGVKV